MYRNTVYSEDNIVDLAEYRNSSLHQKRQQEHLYKKQEKKKKSNPKSQKKNKLPGSRINQHFRALSSNVVNFIVAITLVGLLCFGVAYCLKSGNTTTKAEPASSSLMAKY